MAEPLVSVCVPLYNGGALLERCLSSVLFQTLADYELLVVDDGSSDGSYERAKALLAQEPRARVLRNERNLGLVPNWNRCLELARGRFIKFVFQDDTIDPRCLEKLVEAYCPGVGLVVCKRRFEFAPEISEKRKTDLLDYFLQHALERHFPGQTLISPTEFSALALERSAHNCIGEPTAVLIARAALEQVGLFNPRLIMICDWEMWLRIGVRFPIAVVPEELATFRVHEGSESARNLALRPYQAFVLDPLIVVHELLHGTVYGAFRAHLRASPLSQLRLKRKFIEAAYRARPQANAVATTQQSAWTSLCKSYPSLRWIVLSYFPTRAWLAVLRRALALKHRVFPERYRISSDTRRVTNAIDLMSKIASFDVFDTLLTRAVGAPASVFLLLGRKFAAASLIPCSAEAFARARMDAERRAFKNHGSGFALQHIYEELAHTLGLTQAFCVRLMEEECVLEESLIHPVPDAQARVRQAREQGNRIIFVSDMYLPAAFVTRQLARHGIWQEGDSMYMSCEHGAFKRDGLFMKVLSAEQVRPQAVTHTGDHQESDISAAQRTGLRVQRVMETHLNRYEQLLETHVWNTEGLSSAIAGASRLARLTILASSRKEAARRDVTAGVIAPTLVSYVLWILQRAQHHGLKRLYFVARDGQVLLEIARQLVSKLGLSLELRYLYGSGQVWNLPGLMTLHRLGATWIFERTDLLSVSMLLARVHVDPREVGDLLDALGFPPSEWSRHLTEKERTALSEAMRTTRLSELILQRAAQERQVLVRFLKQEGVLDPIPSGLVDIGWQARQRSALRRAVRGLTNGFPMGFYFGIDVSPQSVVNASEHQDLDEVDHREAYLFDRRTAVGYVGSLPQIHQLLESFCAADHGRVVRYTEHDGRVSPVCEEAGRELLLQWGLPNVKETIRCFVDHLVLDPSLVNPWADMRRPIIEVLRAFWLKPQAHDVLAWGNFPYEDDQCGAYWKPLADRYRWRDVLKTLRAGWVVPHHRAAWRAGSWELTPRPIRVALAAAVRLGEIRDGLGKRVKRVCSVLTVKMSTATDPTHRAREAR